MFVVDLGNLHLLWSPMSELPNSIILGYSRTIVLLVLFQFRAGSGTYRIGIRRCTFVPVLGTTVSANVQTDVKHRESVCGERLLKETNSNMSLKGET